MISFSISSFFFYTLTAFLDIIKSLQYKKKEDNLNVSKLYHRPDCFNTDVGIAFMMMNLSKYWNRRWSKDQSSLRKNKNNKKKTVKQLKLRVGLIVFWYLKVSFFPDT